MTPVPSGNEGRKDKATIDPLVDSSGNRLRGGQVSDRAV